MRKEDLVVGIVGLSMGRHHVEGMVKAGITIGAICDCNEETLNRIGDENGIPAEKRFTDYKDLVKNPEINVAVLVTPDQLHRPMTEEFLEAGKHVLCEKPLTITAAQARELEKMAKDAYEKNGQVCGMVFNNRHIASIRHAKELIDGGRLGKIISFDFKYLHNSCIDPERSAGWKQDKDICGAGTLFDLGAHIVDLCRYLCGEFSEVYAKEQIAFPTHRTADGGVWETNADEAVYMTATLECGAVGTLTAGKINIGENDGLTFSIYGTEGALKFDLMESDWLYFYDANAEGGNFGGLRGFTKIECVGRYPAPAGKFPSPKAQNGWLRGHIASMYSYLSSVAEGKQASPSFHDGAVVQIILDAAHRSHLCGRSIKIDG